MPPYYSVNMTRLQHMFKRQRPQPWDYLTFHYLTFYDVGDVNSRRHYLMNTRSGINVQDGCNFFF